MIGQKRHPTLDELTRQAHEHLGVTPRKPPRAQPEHDLQAALVARVRVWNPHAGPMVRKVRRGKVSVRPAGAWEPGPLGLRFPDLLDLYAVPNGGARSKATAGRLKMEGVLSGPPDLNLDLARRGSRASGGWTADPFHGLRLETKLENTKPSPEQAEFMARLVQRGYAVAVWRTLDEGVSLLTRYITGEWVQTPDLLK